MSYKATVIYTRIGHFLFQLTKDEQISIDGHRS